MILKMPKFIIGQEVYCHHKGGVFLTVIKERYKIDGLWCYDISGDNHDGSETISCPECVLSTRINDKKVQEGEFNNY